MFILIATVRTSMCFAKNETTSQAAATTASSSSPRIETNCRMPGRKLDSEISGKDIHWSSYICALILSVSLQCVIDL